MRTEYPYLLPRRGYTTPRPCARRAPPPWSCPPHGAEPFSLRKSERSHFSAFLITATIVAWILLLTPTAVFLVTGWVCRRDRLMNFLTGDILRAYYVLFDPKHEFKTDNEYVRDFHRRFNRRYGRRYYAFPIFLLALISGLGLWAAPRGGVHPRSDREITPIFGQGGSGVIAAPSAIEASVRRQYGVVVVGRLEEVRERFYAISIERRMKHPAIIAITESARSELFSQPRGVREGEPPSNRVRRKAK